MLDLAVARAQRHARRHPPARVGGGALLEPPMGLGLRLERDDPAAIAPCTQGRAVLAGIGADVDHAADPEALEHRDQLRLEAGAALARGVRS